MIPKVLYLASQAVHATGDTPDVSFVPPLVRRRLSPLQKIYFSLAHRIGGMPHSAVFASRYGEDSLTRRLVEDFHADGTVSPNRFSASVYNAAPGLWSVHTGNTAPYTAVAAGDDTIECGLLEAVCAEAPSLFVYAEETSGGYGVAMSLSADGQGRKISVLPGVPSRPPIAFESLVGFLEGATSVLEGRWIALNGD